MATIRPMNDLRNLLLLASLSLGSTAAVSWAQNPLEQHTQKSEEGAQSPSTGGSNTAGAFPPVLGKDNQPITVSGTVASGPVPFEDITAKAGLTRDYEVIDAQLMRLRDFAEDDVEDMDDREFGEGDVGVEENQDGKEGGRG